jgi:hypothetical protein
MIDPIQHYVCLFCNQSIQPTAFDPCRLQVSTRADQTTTKQQEQSFYCHAACLKAHAAIHPGNFYLFDSVGESPSDSPPTFIDSEPT